MYTSRGLSLIEILIVVGVVGILAAVALPAYREHVLKANRKEALAALGRIQIAQESRRGSASAYGTLADIGVAASTEGGLYTLAISNLTATTYTATATATGTQAADTACATIVATHAGPDIGTPAKKACWAQ